MHADLGYFRTRADRDRNELQGCKVLRLREPRQDPSLSELTA